jgi:hypothetical protein
MNGHRGVRFVVSGVMLLASVACGGGADNPITGSFSGQGVRILTPRSAEDTIQARLSSALTLEVHGADGKSVLAAKVTVSARRDAPVVYNPLAFFSLQREAPAVLTLSEVTDARGQLTVHVQLGVGVGTGWIVVDAGELGRDSIKVTIRVGAPARLTTTPRDTAVAIGASYTLKAEVRDRMGNLLSDVATFASRRVPVASVSNGSTVRSSATGHVYVVGTVGTAVDSVAVEVVPTGTLAAFRFIYSSGDVATLATFDLDGSNYRTTLIPGFAFNNYAPHWIPQQNLLVFHGRDFGSGYELALFTMDAANQRKVLYAPATEADGAYPQPSRDGTWIYYTQRVGRQSSEIWRMRNDGTGRSRVGPKAGYYDSDSQPSPSPDGRTIVYASGDGGAGTGIVRINRLDIATGVESSLGAVGKLPRWSPVGNEIAYLTEIAVHIVQADGTGDRVLATGERFDDRDGQLDWSPDGKWLVTCVWSATISGRRQLALIERATGELIPLPFSSRDNLCEATWKR